MKRTTKMASALGVLAFGAVGNVVVANSALAKSRAHSHGHVRPVATVTATDPDNVQLEEQVQSGDQTALDTTISDTTASGALTRAHLVKATHKAHVHRTARHR